MFLDLNTLLKDVSLSRPEVLYLLALPAAVFLWSVLNLRSISKLSAPVLRAAALSLFVLALAGPQRMTRREGAAPRPALVDLSASITSQMRDWDRALLIEGLKLRAGDPALAFGSAAVPTTAGAVTAMLESAAGCEACDPSATNLEDALSRLAANRAARGGPAVLLTDGWQNRGAAPRAIERLVSAGIRLYIFTPPGAHSVPNVAMIGLELPSALSKAAPFTLGVTMDNFNDVPVAGTIDVYRNSSLAEQRRVVVAHGQRRFDFLVQSENTGLVSYQAVFKPDNRALDIYPEDDSLRGWVGVGARRKVLILTATARDANYLETAVRRMGLEPVAIAVESGQWNGTVTGYDAVILNDLARARLSGKAQNELAAYVERGGTLAMVGGDQSFGLGGYQDSPIAQVMPVTMKPPERKERTRALVLIIDKSGSMGREDKLVYAKAAAKTAIHSLKDNDLVSVIGFDSQPFVVVPLAPLSKGRSYFDEMVDRLKAQGRTFLLPALEEAERSLAPSGAQLKHVVILTDGETGGTADMYYSLVSSMHHDGGVTISAIAVGSRANLPLLKAIARYGGGSFYQTDSASNLPRIFVEDVKRQSGQSTLVEKEFVPHVASPSQVLRDIAGRKLAPLKGYVSTELKPRASLDAYVERSATREPLIASWKYGAGKALAITTDASGRWSGPWITSNAFSTVWDRVLAWMTPEKAAEQKLDVALGYQGGRIHIKLTDYSDKPGLGSHLATALITRPDGTKAETALGEQVPGELSGAIDAPEPGTYYLEVKSIDLKDRPFPPLAYTVNPAINAELPRPEPNYGLLEQLASATGGRLNPSTRDVELTRPTLIRSQPLDGYLIAAAMVMLIVEAFVRRLTV